MSMHAKTSAKPQPTLSEKALRLLAAHDRESQHHLLMKMSRQAA